MPWSIVSEKVEYSVWEMEDEVEEMGGWCDPVLISAPTLDPFKV